MDSNTNSNDGRRFKWGREIRRQFAGDLIRTTDPRELEANRLAIMAQEAEDLRLAEIERDRLIKEWKAANPNSDHEPWRYQLELFAQSATNYPLGWAESFEQIENLITMSRKEFYQRAQEAMNEGRVDAYYKFIRSMSDLACEEGFRRSNNGGVK